jgi:hypothetical protein
MFFDIEDQILRYLKNHPSAADSSKGIQDWWISSQSGEVSLDLVQRALDRLEAQRKIMRTVIDGTVIYREAPRLNRG